jgi:Zn-dependent peptidase ImmA (M78 family)/transcriptional regulator with XRE-family HTH domain
MAKGIQAFSGERLEEARLARGLTQTSLAQLVDRDSSTISAWEGGRQNPDWDSVARIANALRVRPSLFLREFGGQPAAYFFRSNASVTLGLQKKSKARLKWAQSVASELVEWIDFPEVDFPALDTLNHRMIDDRLIEEAAVVAREHWGLGRGPIDDTIGVLENAGALVVKEELGGVKMDGVSVWCSIERRPYVLLASDKASAVRSRFDAAHELAHLVLHKNVREDDLNRIEHAELERQAHKFASAFLLPAQSFANDVTRLDLDSFVSLKSKWRVSISAMVMRCHQLDFISDAYKEKLFKYMSARGWRKSEPLDDLLPIEQPSSLASAIKLVIEAGRYSREQFCELVGLEPGDIESLASLPKGYLRQEAAPVVKLKGEEGGISSEGTGVVLPFKPKL